MASTLNFEFLNDLSIGQTVTFRYKRVNSDEPDNTVTFTWVKSRSKAFEVTATDGLDTVNLFESALKLDTGNLKIFKTITSYKDTVLLTGYTNIQFFDVSTTAPSSKLKYTFNNAAAIDDPKITNLLVSSSDVDVCDKVKITFDVGADIDVYVHQLQWYYPFNETGSGIRKLTIEHDRGIQFSIYMMKRADYPDMDYNYPKSIYPSLIANEDSGFPIVPGEIINIPKLLEQNIVLKIDPTIQGGTVTVKVINSIGLDLEYSLDNSPFNTNNVFLSQAKGDYVVRVKDQYGCIKSKAYTVTGLGLADPIISVSKANSIGFIKEQVVDNVTIFKNNTNSFDCNDFVGISYCDDILFNTKDNVTIQVKSNYKDLAVTLRKENGNNVPLNITKKTANIGRFDDLDCKIYKHASGRLGLYFGSGNRYDESGAVVDTYILDGNLPDFAIIGNDVNIKDLGGFKVFDIVLDRDINRKVILIDYMYSGASINSRVKSIFNVLPFDIHEFEINWSTYGAGLYDVTIEATDPNYDDVNLVSENIDVVNEDLDVLTVIYYNDLANNKDIFYKYGIRHIMRIPYLSYTPSMRDETTINITDNSVYVNRSELNESDTIIFGEMSRSKVRRLSIALSSDNLFVNGIGYAKDGGLALKAGENINAHTIECTLMNKNVVYNNVRNLDTGVDADYKDLLIPSLLNMNGNFLKL